MDERSIQPVILTCDSPRRDSLLEFMQSYREHVWGINPHTPIVNTFQAPVVVVDITKNDRLTSDFIGTIQSLWPKCTYIHPCEAMPPFDPVEQYNSIQAAANFALVRALLEAIDCGAEWILFLEDDIKFSSKFAQFLRGYEPPQNAGMISLYLPGSGHPRDRDGSVLVDYYYGTQAVLFRRSVIEVMVQEFDFMMSHWGAGYDIRWSRYVVSKDWKVYQTEKSYVQHIGTQSLLHGDDRFHTTAVFEE